jgi:flagellar biosynthetic protein FlhB
VGYVLYRWLTTHYSGFLSMANMDLPEAGQYASVALNGLMWRLLSILIMIAVLDYAWQRFRHERSLRMSKDEIKQEMRQQEGAPEIRMALRRRQRALSRNRMMAMVARAHVVVTNPTHYAVALVYDPSLMDAPQVVAMGQRLTALRIREIATENNVPIVEDPPLARALFSSCRLGDLVPAELYAAVAEVLAYVYRLTGRPFVTAT